MDERLLFDIFSAVVLLAVAVLGSWLPLHLSRGSKASQAGSFKVSYHLGNCLSAGVMLSAGFCHLLADALHGLAFVGRFPMANFLAAVGFLVTLAADQIVHVISHDSPAASGSPKDGQQKLLDQQDLELAHGPAQQRARTRLEKQPLLDVSLEEAEAVTNGGGGSPRGKAALNGHALDGSRGGSAVEHAQDLHVHVHDESSGGHLDVLFAPGAPKLHFATAVLLAVALCVHSVLEGMALGAQRSMRSTQDIMLAIAAHKGLAAYALGSSVVESGANIRRFWAVTLTFSLATPLAIFIGYGLSEVSQGQGGEALSALASGTFLYVAMMEVIPRELSGAGGAAGPRWMRPAKVLALLLGFAAMSVLAIWA